MTREQIDAIERLLAKATPGPWWMQREYDGGRTVCSMRHQTETVCVNKASHVEGNPWDAHWDNANLIQELRNNAEALLAAARRALELEEALADLGKRGVFDLVMVKLLGDRGYQIGFRVSGKSKRLVGEGATPLEAINNARRGM